MAWIESADAKLGEQGEVKSAGELGKAIDCPSGIRWWTGAVKDPFFGNGLGLGAFKAAVGEGKFSPEAFNNGEKANALFAGKIASAMVVEVPNKYLGKKIF